MAAITTPQAQVLRALHGTHNTSPWRFPECEVERLVDLGLISERVDQRGKCTVHLTPSGTSALRAFVLKRSKGLQVDA